METHLVFVYGTLRRGGSNAFRMDGAGFVAAGTVDGRLYRIDWYPGIVLDPAAGPVRGDLFRVAPDQLAALDMFEGPEYRRVETVIATDGGGCETAWVWEWILPADESARIPGGDWLEGTVG